ncbi:DUF4376 domain-containing protein [Rhodocyclus tenuis]|uniref:DUF4376 domain-containing protein n=1 Tax=Rhodocyclus tenuis TaxID=1066 RepID=A0A840G3X1_RHOTE|nr:hypothetical protein [Rhodocyclus tenuis]MBB4249117.1 hypothetical protein [Rhodocyclus tenuis]
MEKIVSQLDGDGFFVGAAIADESPLEPGKFLLPGGCIDVSPPDVPPGKAARWNGEGFVLSDIISQATDDASVLDPRAVAKTARAEAVAAITVAVADKVFDGDEVAQGRMARAILGMRIGGAASIRWTLADNTSVDVSLNELEQALVLAGARQAELWPI